MENLPAKPTGFNALSPPQQQAHRTKIGVRAEAILGQFWRDDETPDAVRALEIEGWMDVLENCSHSEIRTAWAKYQRTGPRTQSGKLYKPDAGALYQIIQDARPKPSLVSPARKTTPEEDEEYRQKVARDRINPDRQAQAEAILSQFGMNAERQM